AAVLAAATVWNAAVCLIGGSVPNAVLTGLCCAAGAVLAYFQHRIFKGIPFRTERNWNREKIAAGDYSSLE
ncbi:MAG: hypothetical protein ACOX6J_06305, partial [Oscillospiraceae bacterium]